MKKILEKFGRFQKSRTFAASNEKDDKQQVILDYGVMVTQQILVLFFLVRVRVVQLTSRFGSPHGEEPDTKVWAMV